MKREPTAVRVGFTLWMAFWVPTIVWTAGPQNFWWICNLAQFLLLYAVWRPNRLLISSQAGTVTIIGLAWGLDLLVALILGGNSVTGITGYMFNPELPLIQRLASTYHLWLPAFAVWLCRRQGFDSRGLWLQCIIGTLAILGGWLFGDPERNLNYSRAPFGIEQTWLPEPVYIGFLCVATALLVYVPGHFLVRWILLALSPSGKACQGTTVRH
ncbi:MAG: hypothetical protein RQ741_08820 [Wenzhouxiangellaceae bacterium]|nr:hypothetical protein [Wenzhouxiangellaceae bacterium]